MITQKIIARTDSLKLDKIISRYGEDSMRQVVFIIVRPEPDSEELIPIIIPEDAVGSFRILKPSGNFVIVPMSKSVLASGETAFDVVLPASANTAKGSGYYDIRITSNTDKYYFTAQGDFIIDDNIISYELLEDVSEVNGLIFPDDFLTTEDHVAIIDDDTISTDSTWSSDKISEEIEAHAGWDISKTVSGNPITFDDGADAPLVKCDVTITGSQDLHGQTKPWVGGVGKNKLENTANTNTINGVTFTVNSDGSVTLSGTATAQTDFIIHSAESNVLPSNQTLILTGGISANISLRSNIDGNNYPCQGDPVTINTTSGSFSGNTYIRISNGTDTTGNTVYPMIRLATESDSTFAPYENICPITAYTEGEIEVRGKNLLVNDFEQGAINSGAGYTYDTLKVSNSTRIRTANLISLDPNSTYTISCDFSKYRIVAQPFDESGFSINPSSPFNDWKDSAFSFTRTHKVAIAIKKTSETDITPSEYEDAKPQIELGSTATPYEPYTSTTHTTTFPSAIYRGSEDVVNGEVTTEWGMIASYAGETLPGEWISDRDEYTPGTPPTTGAQVAYELASPTTASVTVSNAPVKSLSGYSHIESTTGDMEVEYITERFQPLIDSIKQL